MYLFVLTTVLSSPGPGLLESVVKTKRYMEENLVNEHMTLERMERIRRAPIADSTLVDQLDGTKASSTG